MSGEQEACEEGSYEYECMRAELLGLEKPDYEEYLKNHPPNPVVEQEEVAIEVLKDIDAQDNEQYENVSGGLAELNSILSVTQKKLNRFKTTCGSLTNLLKFRVGQGSTESLGSEKGGKSENGVNANGARCDETQKNATAIDKLDAMLESAERAEVSMAEQNKQMKRFLR